MIDENTLNSKTLVMLTASFPYGYGETFLESELAVVSKYFKQIFILPEKKHERIRRAPENVVVLSASRHKSDWLGVLYVMIRYRGLLNEFLVNLFNKPARNKVLLMNLKWAISRKKTIQKALDLPDSNLIFYSYWADHSAVALCLIGNRITRITRVHGWDVYEERQKYEYLPCRRFLLQKLDAVYAISDNAKTYIENIYESNGNLAVSRLGVKGEQARAACDDKFAHMISISNVIPLKRVGRIAETFGRLKKRNLQWTHYGSSELLADLKAEYGGEHFKGQLSNSQMLNELNDLKEEAFLINLSEYEGIPVSMMEAMSYGIPCVGTNVGGVSEIIEDGVNGFLLSANPTNKEIDAVVNKLISLEPSEAQELRKNARTTWENKFKAETNFKNFAEHLQGL